MSRDKIMRVGIMCNGTVFQSWQARCIELLMELDNVEISLLIMDADYDNLIPPTLPQRIANFLSYPFKTKISKLRSFIFKKRLWSLFFARSVGRHSLALKSKDMSKDLADVPRLYCRTKKEGQFVQYFSDEDIENVKRHDLDFILRFAFNIIRGGILNAARYGVWSFHHDDEEKYRGSPPCFWEIYNGDPVTGSILQRLTDRLDGGVVLHKGFFVTASSYVTNLDTAYFCSAEWPARVCKDIQYNPERYSSLTPSKSQAPIAKTPTNSQMVLFLLRKLIKKQYKKIVDSLFIKRDIWDIGIIGAPISSFVAPDYEPRISWFPELSENVFLADPFALKKNDTLYILAEYFDYDSSKGLIAVVEAQTNGSFPNPRPVMDMPYHMSYPYLFEKDSEIFCVPEAIGSGEISLYRAEEFPWKWSKAAVMVRRVEYSDPTVFFHNGLWWLFYTAHEGFLNAHRLFAHYAYDIYGPWFPHGLNPLKMDVRSSRAAGTPFAYNGGFYRPAQDCSRTYGGSIVLNRIERLSPHDYYEEPDIIIGPKGDKYLDGIHTISSAGDITIIDGKRTVLRYRKAPIWKSSPAAEYTSK